MALGARRRAAAEPRYALAWIDISTGAFRVAETDADRLARRHLPRRPARADRRRAGVPRRGAEAGLRHARPRRQPAAAEPVRFGLGAPAASPASIGVATPDSFGAFSRAELSAISGAIAYVEKTQKAERPPLSRPEREEAGSTLFIDPATRANLELLRTHVGQPRRLAVQGDRPHGDRRRRAAARRPADVAADRSRRRSTGGWIRSSFFVAEPRLVRRAARSR